MLGVQAGLDALGQVNFLFGIQQADATNLLEVVLDRVGGGACRNHTTLRIAGGDDVLFFIIRVGNHISTLFLGLLRSLRCGLAFVFLVFVILIVNVFVVRLGIGIFKIIDVLGFDVVKILIKVIDVKIFRINRSVLIKVIALADVVLRKLLLFLDLLGRSLT